MATDIAPIADRHLIGEIQMTDRERLIDLIKKAEKQESIDFFTADLDEAVDMSGGTQFNGSIEYLADYLISNGVVVMPCKVGDTVYCYDEDLYAILDYRIEQIIFSGGFLTLYSGVCCNEDVLLSDIDFWETDLGKTVFLTREEAEKALKERESNA